MTIIQLWPLFYYKKLTRDFRTFLDRSQFLMIGIGVSSCWVLLNDMIKRSATCHMIDSRLNTCLHTVAGRPALLWWPQYAQAPWHGSQEQLVSSHNSQHRPESLIQLGPINLQQVIRLNGVLYTDIRKEGKGSRTTLARKLNV